MSPRSVNIIMPILIGLVAVLLVGSLFGDRAESFDKASWSPRAQLVVRQEKHRTTWGLEPAQGRQVLHLVRGRERSTLTTSHGWIEELYVEVPDLRPGMTIDVPGEGVAVAFARSSSYTYWPKRNSAKGYIRVEAESANSLRISYDISVAAVPSSWFLLNVTFRGRRVFSKSEPRVPEGVPPRLVCFVQRGVPEDTIHDAAERGDVAAVKSFLAVGVGVNARDDRSSYEQWTALHYAATTGQLEVARILIENKADLNARDRMQMTPLHMAAERGQEAVARALLDAGADVNADGAVSGSANGDGTPLDCARGSSLPGYERMVRLLRERGGKLRKELLY